MNMIDLSTFLPHIKQYAPGIATPTAYFGIRQAAIDFCQRTKTWRYEDEFDITEGEAEQITTPANSVLLDIEHVLFEGNNLEPKTTAWLDDNLHGWRVNESNSIKARYVTQTEQNTLRIVPGAAGHVNLYVWLKPSQDCDQLPDYLGDQYRETIAHGALARILMMPNMPFSNPQLGAMFLGLFNAALDTFQNKGSIGQQRAHPRTKASFF